MSVSPMSSLQASFESPALDRDEGDIDDDGSPRVGEFSPDVPQFGTFDSDESRIGSLSSASNGSEDSDPTELELAQAADRRSRRAAQQQQQQQQLGKPFNRETEPRSQLVSRAELYKKKPGLLPGHGFTAEEYWQLRKAFDM